jgi:hypothetical protein
MDLTAIIQQLRLERDRIDESILALESLAAGSTPRRGRPPKWIVAARSADVSAEPGPKRRGRPPGSGKKAAARKT